MLGGGRLDSEPGAPGGRALAEATEGFSGAEIEQAVIAAMYAAPYEGRELDADSPLEEMRATVPLSVSRREDVEHLREIARGGFVPVR